MLNMSCDIWRPTLGSQASRENSHSVLLNTLYTCSLDVDKNLVEHVKVIVTTRGGHL